MDVSPKAFCERVSAQFPASRPKLTSFPSGAFMIDVVVDTEIYVVEHQPSLGGFGVSRMSTAVFGWEGVEKSFESLDAAEKHIVALLLENKT